MPGEAPPDPYQDALIAARLCAIEPGLGGMVLRGGLAADKIIATLCGALPEGAPVRRLPGHIDDDRLLGGIDLTATLASGRATARTGLLAEADGGVLIVPMAERLPDALAGRLAAAIDTGEIVAERDGATLRANTRFVTVALDEGIEGERPPAGLTERLAFWVDLSAAPSPTSSPAEAGAQLRDANKETSALPLENVDTGPRPSPGRSSAPFADATTLQAITATAAALGVDSARAPLFALRAARAAAQLARRDAITAEDVSLAARLVLAPRATRLPAEPDAPHSEPPPPDGEPGETEQVDPGPLEDIVLAAALAALPRDVLARIAAGRGRQPARTTGAGERRMSRARGRPLGARPGLPRGGLRLSLIDTLRAAAPWQRLRGASGQVRIRRDDLRVRRFEARAQALTIFAVDASGSSALARLAEAKGAVELLLAEAYVKRAEVALVAFRGSAAELLLPPTRSLARARRSLAELPGGGGTPLATGLHAARELAESGRAKGRTPFVVVLTDGRANVAADGATGRAAAQADALAAAKAIGATGIASAFVDISARPGPEGAALAAAMRADYLPLPRADAAAMHAAVGAVRR